MCQVTYLTSESRLGQLRSTPVQGVVRDSCSQLQPALKPPSSIPQYGMVAPHHPGLPLPYQLWLWCKHSISFSSLAISNNFQECPQAFELEDFRVRLLSILRRRKISLGSKWDFHSGTGTSSTVPSEVLPAVLWLEVTPKMDEKHINPTHLKDVGEVIYFNSIMTGDSSRSLLQHLAGLMLKSTSFEAWSLASPKNWLQSISLNFNFANTFDAMPSTNQLLPATLGSQVAKQAGNYKQGSPLLDRTAFQTSLQKHQVPICLIQKWECVLGSAIINHLLVAMHRLSFKHTSKREALPWHLIPSKTQLCCFLPTPSIDSIDS